MYGNKKKQPISMTQQLKELVYEREIEKLRELTDYYKYRIATELKIIKQMNAEDVILSLERIVSVAKKLRISLEVDQEHVKSSFVCYLLGISKTNPVEAGLRFELPADIREIGIEHSLEDMYAMRKAFTAEDKMLFFDLSIKYAPKDEPTENR
jgi:DNA polymerase III alpha subunit